MTDPLKPSNPSLGTQGQPPEASPQPSGANAQLPKDHAQPAKENARSQTIQTQSPQPDPSTPDKRPIRLQAQVQSVTLNADQQSYQLRLQIESSSAAEPRASQLKGLVLTSQTSQPLPKGSRLTLELVGDNRLKLVQVKSLGDSAIAANPKALAEGLKQSLPNAHPLQSTLKAMLSLVDSLPLDKAPPSNSANGQKPSPWQDIAQQINALIKLTSSPPQTLSPEQLAQRLANSGLFAEAKLRWVAAQLSAASPPPTKTQPPPNGAQDVANRAAAPSQTGAQTASKLSPVTGKLPLGIGLPRELLQLLPGQPGTPATSPAPTTAPTPAINPGATTLNSQSNKNSDGGFSLGQLISKKSRAISEKAQQQLERLGLSSPLPQSKQSSPANSQGLSRAGSTAANQQPKQLKQLQQRPFASQATNISPASTHAGHNPPSHSPVNHISGLENRTQSIPSAVSTSQSNTKTTLGDNDLSLIGNNRLATDSGGSTTANRLFQNTPAALREDLKIQLNQLTHTLLKALDTELQDSGPGGEPEDRLIRMLLHSQQTMVQTHNNSLPIADQSLLLSNILSLLKRKLTTATESQPTSKEEGIRLLKQLTLQSLGALNRVQSQQYQTLLNQHQTDNGLTAQEWRFELPLGPPNQFTPLEIQLEKEPDRQPKTAPSQQRWQLRLHFDFSEQRAFSVQVGLHQEQISLTIWSQHQDSLQLLNKQLDELVNALQEAGFKVEQALCRYGALNRKTPVLSRQLIDIKT